MKHKIVILNVAKELYDKATDGRPYDVYREIAVDLRTRHAMSLQPLRLLPMVAPTEYIYFNVAAG